MEIEWEGGREIKWESISLNFKEKWNGTERNSKEMEREGGREIKWESISIKLYRKTEWNGTVRR